MVLSLFMMIKFLDSNPFIRGSKTLKSRGVNMNYKGRSVEALSSAFPQELCFWISNSLLLSFN